MTVAVFFVSSSGIAMGTDSRVTSFFKEGKSYEDSYKKLVKFGEFPIAMAMVGAGHYAYRTFDSLVAEAVEHYNDSELPGSVESVANTFIEIATPVAKDSGNNMQMTVLIGGFSPKENFGEMWEATLPSGKLKCQRKPGERTIGWRGCCNAINTLWYGYDGKKLRQSFKDFGIDATTANEVIKDYQKKVAWGPERLDYAKPLGGSADLVKFLLSVQINYERFMPGKGLCNYPIQLVTISRSEGVKWLEKLPT